MPLRRPHLASLPPVGAGLRRRTALGAAIGATLVACGGSEPVATGPLPEPLITPSTFEMDLTELQPLTMLGPCQDVTRPEVPVVEDAVVLPPEGFLVQRTEQGGLVNTRGYVAMTPLQFQVWVRDQPGLEMLTVENEIQESETLYTNGERRIFLKAAAVCELGSAFIAVVADEVDADAVPTPSGSPQG